MRYETPGPGDPAIVRKDPLLDQMANQKTGLNLHDPNFPPTMTREQWMEYKAAQDKAIQETYGLTPQQYTTAEIKFSTFYLQELLKDGNKKYGETPKIREYNQKNDRKVILSEHARGLLTAIESYAGKELTDESVLQVTRSLERQGFAGSKYLAERARELIPVLEEESGKILEKAAEWDEIQQGAILREAYLFRKRKIAPDVATDINVHPVYTIPKNELEKARRKYGISAAANGGTGVGSIVAGKLTSTEEYFMSLPPKVQLTLAGLSYGGILISLAFARIENSKLVKSAGISFSWLSKHKLDRSIQEGADAKGQAKAANRGWIAQNALEETILGSPAAIFGPAYIIGSNLFGIGVILGKVAVSRFAIRRERPHLPKWLKKRADEPSEEAVHATSAESPHHNGKMPHDFKPAETTVFSRGKQNGRVDGYTPSGAPIRSFDNPPSEPQSTSF